jgi:hypothetical protein
MKMITLSYHEDTSGKLKSLFGTQYVQHVMPTNVQSNRIRGAISCIVFVIKLQVLYQCYIYREERKKIKIHKYHIQIEKLKSVSPSYAKKYKI